jgi:hypothetical protein
MNIAIMSTYNQVCGIADYTASLVRHIPEEHEVKIIAPYLTEVHPSVCAVGPEDPRTHRYFNATIWDGRIGIEADKITEIAEWADVLHIQFQDALYHHDWFLILLKRLHGKCKLVVTLHDTCLGKIWPLMDFFDEVFTMKPEVKAQAPRAQLIPMPIYNRKPLLKGFGLGRSKHDVISRICNDLRIDYQYTKADDNWMPIDELLVWLRDSDGIVLFYDEVSTAGSSAGARTALSTRRPVFVNRVTWFNDIPEDAVIKFNDELDLKRVLEEHFSNDYMEKCSYENVISQHLEAYSR